MENLVQYYKNLVSIYSGFCVQYNPGVQEKRRQFYPEYIVKIILRIYDSKSVKIHDWLFLFVSRKIYY